MTQTNETDSDFDPRRIHFHQLAFTVQGSTEADVDDEIDRKLVKLVSEPSDWTVVTKNMSIQTLAQSMDGENQITVLHADCLAMKVAGLVPWPIAPAPGHSH